MTLKASLYDQLSREELIRLLEARDNEPDNAEIYISSETPTIKRIISEVLAILFNEENKPIEKAMNLLLGYFNADWGYVAIFEEDGFAANFTCEVMSSWVKIPKDDRNKLTCDTIPWIIDTVKAGHDIVLGDIAGLPAEADIDKILLTEQHLKSMLIVPLTFHNKVQGFIGFDSIRTSRFWTASEVEDMHIIAGIFSIIIERWQTNYNLEESRKRISKLSTKFQQFFNNLPIGVELYDAEGYLIDINDADTKIFGSSREQLLGVNLFKNPAVPERILNQIKKKKAFSFPLAYDFNCIRDTRYYNSNISDEVKYLMVKGIGLNDREFGHIGYLLIISDETEKRVKEEQTQNNLAILKAVLLSGHSLIVEYDIGKKELFVNPLLNETPEDNKLFNYLRSNKYMTIGGVQQIVRSADNVNLLFQVIEGKQDHCSFECRTAIENETIWIRINAQAYKTKGSKRQNKMICHITNITEEKLLEEKLHHAEYETRQSELEIQKVREADKLKSAFLANMSHEIRTPLNAIIGFSNILAETDDKEEKEEFVKIINKNSDLLLRLITDILDFSKIESGVLDYSLSDTSLKDIFHEQFQVHAMKMPEKVSLICDFAPLADVFFPTDPKRVTQVLS
ncbi:PAS domain-containing protein, partial [Parabacteroides merdae]|nr:PAS domain-containing protein [Parabacteroides merdae]